MTNYRITTAPVLIPNTPDCDFQNGETPLSTDQIQTLQQTYNQYQIIDYQHQFMNDGPHFLQRVGIPIKSWISTKSTTYTDVLGNTRTIPEGTWWLQSKITDPEMIKKIDQGKLTAYSLTTTAKNIADKYKSYMTSNKSSLKKDQVAELEQISRKYRTNINDIPDPVAFTVTLTDFPCVGGAVFSKKCLVNSQHGISTKMDDNMTTEDNKFSISDLKSLFNIFSSFKSEDKPVDGEPTQEQPSQEQPQDNTKEIDAIVDGKIKVNNEELKSYFKETIKEIITEENQKQDEKPQEPAPEDTQPKDEEKTSTKSNPEQIEQVSSETEEASSETEEKQVSTKSRQTQTKGIEHINDGIPISAKGRPSNTARLMKALNRDMRGIYKFHPTRKE